MGVSRRTFLLSAAGAAVATGSGAAALLDADPAFAASAPGDVVGKITVGYQGWFACIGDGAPIDAWWHWSNNESQSPSPSNNNIKAWPDMSIYSNVYQTAYANLGNGAPATLFSSYDQQTVNTHFSLMQQHGCDTAALQRFDPNGSEGPTRNAITAKVNTAAQAYGRKFYIMYDATGWTNMQTEMPADWTANMSQYTSSSAYAHQNGKPVVGIWGFGFNDTNHPWTASACLEVIQWFQSQGCYVMGGVPREWQTGVGGSRSGFLGTYSAFNMISPWMVGAIGTIADSDSVYENYNVPDQAYCNANNIDYQPCVLPGDVSGNQRVHGNFMWEQFYNMVRVGAQGIYISMFDEFGEGNQIVNTAATSALVPVGSGLLALDQDGTACSSDYYLRLTNDGGRMLKGQIALTNVRPTPPEPTGDTTPPTAPTNLAASGTTASSTNLTWTASTDNVGVTGYQVLRNGSVVTTVTATSSTDSGLAASTTYSYQVKALDAAGNVSAGSNTVSVTTSAGSGGGTNLALNRPATSSGYVQSYGPGNAVDGNTSTYWESTNSAFPQWLQVDLGSTVSIGSITLNLPPSSSWSTRTQTLSVQGSTDGNTFTTIVGSATYTFNPSTGNAVSITLPTTSTRYVRLNITANSGWPAGQISEFQIFGSGSSTPPPPPPTTNLALNVPATSSGYVQSYTPSNAVDGNTSTYWESTNSAFPQWLQVDLGTAYALGSVTLTLPPSSSWTTRTQTLSVQGSTDNSTFTTIVASATYTFNPATGNTVTISLPSATTRYVRLNITANSGWPAGQISEFQVYAV
jgi:chitodextrinase